MNKSKNEPPDYFGFYNAAFAAYAKTLLGANQLMLGYTAAATRSMLRASALAIPKVAVSVAPAATHVPDEAPSAESIATPVTLQKAADVLDVADESVTREVPPGAFESADESTALEASLYADDTPPHSIEASAAEVTLDPVNEVEAALSTDDAQAAFSTDDTQAAFSTDDTQAPFFTDETQPVSTQASVAESSIEPANDSLDVVASLSNGSRKPGKRRRGKK